MPGDIVPASFYLDFYNVGCLLFLDLGAIYTHKKIQHSF